ncbi:hypothetical protein [uncultured Gammaproteobacteria bacterium]|jgi:hypothetical protein|nr:hypothetical protein [uncultured Gammaproteobacteria bacterium]CAC9966773.1 hypothetical protein [uncultured Gammaproteobacteria bacterium]
MKQEFYNYLINTNRTPNTANIYKSAIGGISKDYSKNINQEIDIYQIQEQNTISEISQKYSQKGEYASAGNKGNGTWRSAIARYSEFFAVRGNNTIDETNIENTNQEEQINFAYERDLQKTLCAQITELFPNYKIYGENNQGIEYSINSRRIDVLLEHIETSDLLVVELKSGDADYKVFGQISMYMGLTERKFPDKKVSGVIISGSIHESLQQACTTTDRIELKVYRMKLELEEA